MIKPTHLEIANETMNKPKHFILEIAYETMIKPIHFKWNHYQTNPIQSGEDLELRPPWRFPSLVSLQVGPGRQVSVKNCLWRKRKQYQVCLTDQKVCKFGDCRIQLALDFDFDWYIFLVSARDVFIESAKAACSFALPLPSPDKVPSTIASKSILLSKRKTGLSSFQKCTQTLEANDLRTKISQVSYLLWKMFAFGWWKWQNWCFHTFLWK